MPAAAVFARDGDAEQAHLAQLRPQVLREGVVVVDLRGARRDLGFGEPAHGVAQCIDFFAERESAHRSSWLQSSQHDGAEAPSFCLDQWPRMRPRKRGAVRPIGSFSLPIALMRSSAMRSAAL